MKKKNGVAGGVKKGTTPDRWSSGARKRKVKKKQGCKGEKSQRVPIKLLPLGLTAW